VKDPQVESIREWAATVETDGGAENPEAVALARIKALLHAYDRLLAEREALGEKVVALHAEAYDALDACRRANDEAGQANMRAMHAAEQVAAGAREVERARQERESVEARLMVLLDFVAEERARAEEGAGEASGRLPLSVLSEMERMLRTATGDWVAEGLRARTDAAAQARREADQLREILRGIIADADATGLRSSTGG
jgi:hypothetical protein